ncbi:MAG: DUF2341 domain-containing protein, partial [Candidatus Aenigmatarchaeota archaeon]
MKKIIFVLFAILFFSFFVTGARADCQSYIYGAPFTITLNNTYYCLATSISNVGATAIQFLSSVENTTLDCQWFSMSGAAASNTYGILLAGKNNTVKNCNISNFDAGIYVNGSNNSIIINNILKGNVNGGIFLASSHNNSLINLSTTGGGGAGISLSSSSYNNVTNITINGGNFGLSLSGSYNTLINIFSYSSNGNQISGSYNNITGGSLGPSGNWDYYLSSAGTTNYFTDTNFTASRKIFLGDSSSWFNYRNDSTLELWLKTNVSASTTLNRILWKWMHANITWNESASTAAKANYNISGLIANNNYTVYNNSVLRYTLNASSCGCINFTIDLTTTPQTIMINTTIPPPTYSLNSTNSTTAGTAVLHSLNWTAVSNTLSGYIFQFCNGTWDGTNCFDKHWWNTSFIRRRNITINNSQNPNILTNYQVPVNITYDSDMAPDFSDLRFTWYNQTSDSEREIPYWIANKSNSQWAYIWLNVTQIPALGYTTVYVYYKNPIQVTSTSDFDSVFIFGDPFDTETLNTTRWTSVDGNPTYNINSDKHYLEVTNMDGSNWWTGKGFHSRTDITFPSTYIVEDAYSSNGVKISLKSDTAGEIFGGSFHVDNSTYSDADMGIVFANIEDDWAASANYVRLAGVDAGRSTADYNSGTLTGTTGTWYNTLARIWKLGGNISIEINGTIRVNEANSQTPNRVHLGIARSSTYAFGTIQFYAFKIRKYTTPEPTYSIGVEEGSWTIDSWVSFSGGTWSNVTKIINSTVGATIAWCVYANDSYNNWNITSCQNPFTYVTTKATVNVSSCSVLNQEGAIYYLESDITNSTTSYCMNISANNVILDCQGHTIDGDDVADYGIYLYRSSAQNTNVEIRNCVITDWDTQGIYLYNSNNNILENLSLSSNPDDGIRLTSSLNNYLKNITASSNNYGIYLYNSQNNNIINSTLSNNIVYDFYVYASSDSYCNNYLQNVTGSNNLPIKYFNSSTNLSNEVLSELVLCNADYSNITNITIDASPTLRNNVLLVHRTDYSKFTNINSSNNYYGILFYDSSYNQILNSTLSGNLPYDFYITASSDSYCNNYLQNVTGSNNLPIKYFNSSTNLSNEVLSELVLC